MRKYVSARVQQTLCKEANNKQTTFVRFETQTNQQNPTCASSMCACRARKIPSPRVGSDLKSHFDIMFRAGLAICRFPFDHIVFASISKYSDFKFGNRVAECVAHLQTFEVLESELILSRKTMLTKFRHVRTFFDTKVYTKPRKSLPRSG